MNKQETLLIILTITSLLFFSFIGLYIEQLGYTPNNTNDFYFHYSLINGKCFGDYAQETCDKYPKTFHFVIGFVKEFGSVIGSLFAKEIPDLFNSELGFFIIATTMILLWGAIVFYIALDFWPALIFFASGFPYLFIYNATYAQFLALLVFTLFFRFLLDFKLNPKHVFVLLVFLLASVFIHSKLLFLMILIIICFSIGKFIKLKNVFPMTFLNPEGIVNVLWIFFLWHTSISTVWLGVKEIIRQKQTGILIFLIILFYLSINDFRIMLMGLPVIFYFAGKYIETATPTFQKTVLIVSLFLFVLNMIYWANQLLMSSTEGAFSFAVF